MLYFKALTEGLSALPRADAGGARGARRARRARRLARAARRARARRSGDGGAAAARRTRSASSARSRSIASTGSRCRRCRGGARPRRRSADGRASRWCRRTARALHDAIARRFDAMLAAGLVDELRRVARALSRSTPAMPSMRCVGYRQAWEFLDGADRRAGPARRRASPRRASSPSASSPGCATHAGARPSMPPRPRRARDVAALTRRCVLLCNNRPVPARASPRAR